MKYLLISIWFFLTLPVFAEECKREATFVLDDGNDNVLISKKYNYSSVGLIAEQEILVLTYYLYYKSGMLYTSDMERLDQVKASVFDMKSKLQISEILNSDNESITLGSISYKDTNSVHQTIFQLNLYAIVNLDCTLSFITELINEKSSSDSNENFSSITKHLRMQNVTEF